MSDTMITAMTAFGAAVLGAVVGGIIGYLLQRQSLAAAKIQHDSDRNDVRKAIGLSLVFKMIRISSDLNNLRKSVRESMERAARDGLQGMPFQIVVPIVPLPDPIKFSSEEMGLILSIDNKLFNELGPMDDLHNSTVAIFELYNTKRSAVLERLGAEMNGNVGTTMLTAEQKRWFDPRAVELNHLVETMSGRTERDTREALQALDHLSAAISKEFGINLRFERNPGV
jgi:hypothetical protein